ncbi:unnamed protein product, partial [Closterium sp. NIES-53]
MSLVGYIPRCLSHCLCCSLLLSLLPFCPSLLPLNLSGLLPSVLLLLPVDLLLSPPHLLLGPPPPLLAAPHPSLSPPSSGPCPAPHALPPRLPRLPHLPLPPLLLLLLLLLPPLLPPIRCCSRGRRLCFRFPARPDPRPARAKHGIRQKASQAGRVFSGHVSVHPAGMASLDGNKNETLHAWVAYNATASLLSVRLSSSPTMPPSALLSFPFNPCDLFHNAPKEDGGEGEAVLVHVGFAAGTGLLPLHTQTHDILSWAFQVDSK